MKYITGFFAFWYDFIVGDAWEVAAGVVLTLLVLGLLATTSAAAQQYGALLLPLVIVGVLAYSLWRVRRPA
jgi:hypothetical protein